MHQIMCLNVTKDMDRAQVAHTHAKKICVGVEKRFWLIINTANKILASSENPREVSTLHFALCLSYNIQL